jgi:hypothetical protein
MGQDVEYGKERMSDGVEILMRDCRQQDQPDSLVMASCMADVVLPPIDSDLMAAQDKPGGELFGERLKTSVIGGDAASAEDGNLHA